ncbi:hypothetical protein SteCoe_20013 [Stentor coeruleus]|uniref:Uncharacterized protein n=1 Tax=Stentor coeruleus TaxID=5963 RepID=A0A1R2BSY8_9CILI|nr:hypothetical protein SteCoe_20013 [Stentor coeruleus]
MASSLPQLAAALKKYYAIQRADFTDEEKFDMKMTNEKAFSLYESIVKCKNRNEVKNIMCLNQEIAKTECKEVYTKLMKCIAQEKGKISHGGAKDFSLCLKEDINFKLCFDKITLPIIKSISDMPIVCLD